MCDTDSFISNFWRAIRNDPDGVAYFADYPTIHQDLTARRHWLAEWSAENAEMFNVDADFYDCQAAGYWVWCVAQWIGGTNDMLLPREDKTPPLRDQMPHVSAGAGGQGVQQRQRMPCSSGVGGRGVQR